MTLGGFPETTAPGVELVAMSPGVSPYFGAAASVCASARKAGIPIVGEIELFAQELAYLKRTQGYAPKVIGITGKTAKRPGRMLPLSLWYFNLLTASTIYL